MRHRPLRKTNWRSKGGKGFEAILRERKERERQRQRQRDRETDRQTDRD